MKWRVTRENRKIYARLEREPSARARTKCPCSVDLAKLVSLESYCIEIVHSTRHRRTRYGFNTTGSLFVR